MTSPEPESLLGVDVYARGTASSVLAEHLGDHRGTVATLVQLGGSEPAAVEDHGWDSGGPTARLYEVSEEDATVQARI